MFPIHNVVITTATTERDGEYLKFCADCDEIISKEITIRPEKIKLEKNKYAYTGKAIEPNVKVYNANGQKLFDDNYKVIYLNNVNPGTATVIVDFKDVDREYVFFEGVMETTFEIYKEEQTESSSEEEEPTEVTQSSESEIVLVTP